MRSFKVPQANAFYILIGLFSATAIGAGLAVNWSWGPVDDPGQVMAMQGLIAQHGYVGGISSRVAELANGDFVGGVFRPLAWIYPALIYSLPSGLAHLIRIAMLVVIVVAPVIYVRRKGQQPSSVLLLVFIVSFDGAATLIQGVTLLSIQEVGGAFFVAIGLLSSNKYARLIFWVLAAFFKGPFAWILIGYAIFHWKRGDKKLAASSAFLGIAVLLTNVLWSLGGTYSGRYITDPFDPQLWANASKILEPVNAVLLVMILWWAISTKSQLTRGEDFIIFAVAFFGFFFQMIPWGFTAYYMGPISYFLAIMLAVTITANPETPKRLTAIGLVVPLFLMIWVVGSNVSLVLRTNEIMRESTVCLGQIADAKVSIFGNALYVTSSPEGPIRMEQNTEIVFPGWRGTLSSEANSVDDIINSGATHILVIDGAIPDINFDPAPVCTSGPISLFRLGENPIK
jgi:hypothetical protein